MSLVRDCKSVTRTNVRHPGFKRRTSPLYFSARSSCNFNSGTYAAGLPSKNKGKSWVINREIRLHTS